MAQTYDEILARNLRAARARIGLGQESVATRMAALGHTSWLRQTVSSAEKGRRRVSAAEVLALALALETAVPPLLTAVPDDEGVDFPTGQLAVESAVKLVTGLNDRSIRWQDDKPVFGAGKSAWLEGDPDAPDAVKLAWSRRDS